MRKGAFLHVFLPKLRRALARTSARKLGDYRIAMFHFYEARNNFCKGFTAA
jgi:hypothetical protein